jgi:ribosomal protein S18 acetylase RimI-like enzyme
LTLDVDDLYNRGRATLSPPGRSTPAGRETQRSIAFPVSGWQLSRTSRNARSITTPFSSAGCRRVGGRVRWTRWKPSTRCPGRRSNSSRRIGASTFASPNSLVGANADAFHVAVARLDGDRVATAMAFEVDGDCGIYNVVTRAHARRRGLATGVTAALLHDAVARGCTSATLQSTPMSASLTAARARWVRPRP